MFTNELNMGLSLFAWIEKLAYGVEIHFFSKVKVPWAVVSKDERTHFGLLSTYWVRWKVYIWYLLGAEKFLANQ